MTTDDQRPESKTVLIVEDEETVASYFQTLLKREGFRAVIALGGKSALDKLKGKSSPKVDLLVLDLVMPDRGGYEVLKELQETDRKNVPVFIVTARNLDPVTVSMLKLESNVREFWKKPIDSDDFIKKVHELLGTVPKAGT